MKKTKATTPRKSAKGSPVVLEAQSPVGLGVVDLGAVRQQIENLIAKNAIEMVETTIEQAGKGHYQAMKYLFEIVGLYPATTPEETPEEESLAALLLRHLKLPVDSSPSRGVTKDCNSYTVAEGSDAVE